MNVRQNSLDAFYQVVERNTTKKQKEVLCNFRLRPEWTNHDIAEEMGVGINNVTPRTGELLEMEFIEKVGDRQIAKGRKHRIYGITQKGKNYMDKNMQDYKRVEKTVNKVDKGQLCNDVKDDLAKTLGYDNWHDLFNNKIHLSTFADISELENQAMIIYANLK